MAINVIPIPAVGYTDVFTYSWWLHPSISLIFLLIQRFRHRTNIWRWCFQSLGISSSGVRKVPSPMEVLPCHANNHCCENGMNFVWSRQRTTRACLKLGYTIPPPPQNKWGNLRDSRIFLFSDPHMELAVQVPSGTGWPRQIIHSWERIRRKTWTSQASLRRVFIDLKFTSLAPQGYPGCGRLQLIPTWSCQLSCQLIPIQDEKTPSHHPGKLIMSKLVNLCEFGISTSHHITFMLRSDLGLSEKNVPGHCPESKGLIIILLEYMEVS